MDKEQVLAVVAGRKITEDDLDLFLKNQPQEHQPYVKNPKYREHYKEMLIALHLYAKLGEEMKLEETEEFQRILESAKLDLLARVAYAELAKDVTVSQEEMEAYYDAHIEEYTEPEVVRARHILVSSEAQCTELLETISSGKMTFEACAKEYSTCPSGNNGGDLGEFARGDMVKEFEDAAFDAKIGFVFGPVRTQFGYHLIKVEEKRAEYKIPLVDVEHEVEKKAKEEKAENLYVAKLNELKEKYLEQ